MACDEECTKQKAQDRLLAVINELPDLMKPSSDDIDGSIQEIQSRTYSDDSDGTPTMNENSSINELLAATMEPPPSPPAQTFESYDPCDGAGGGRWEGATWVKWGTTSSYRTDPNKQSQGVWMYVNSQGGNFTGHYPWRDTCNGQFGNVAAKVWQSEVKRVLISPPPEQGWGPGCTNVLHSCDELTEVVERCPTRGSCSYDFETQTLTDKNGNRWDTNEYNKRAG
jgi:hypothetical protein